MTKYKNLDILLKPQEMAATRQSPFPAVNGNGDVDEV